MQKYLPTNDLLFKKCFTSEDSLHILKAFVKDLLGIEFKQLKPKETYHIDSYKKTFDKLDITRTEVDILAIGEDGSHTTIECQIQPHMYFRERTIFYLAEAFCSPFGNLETANFIKGNNFSALRPAYGINIIDFHNHLFFLPSKFVIVYFLFRFFDVIWGVSVDCTAFEKVLSMISSALLFDCFVF